MAKGSGFKGGEIPTKLGKGQDGFSGIDVYKAKFNEGPEGTVQVGREETVGTEKVATGGRKRG